MENNSRRNIIYLSISVLKQKPFVVFGSLILLFILFGTRHAMAQSDTVADKARKERNWRLSDYVQIHGFIDTQFDYSLNINGLGHYDKNSVFMVRRARFEICGNPVKNLDFRIQADLALTPRLLDAWLRYNFCKYISLQIGQIKTPYTMDNFYSPLDLEFVELSQSVAALAGFNDISGVAEYANGLEVGAMISGTLADYEKKGRKIPILKYYAGVFGGTGINIRKNNLSRDFSARIDFYPFVENLRISGSVYIGRYTVQKGFKAPRNRYSGGIEYKSDTWTLRGEYLQGVTGVYEEHAPTNDSIYRINTRGLYAFVGRWFNCGWGKNSKVQQKIRPLFRYDYYTHDTALPTSASHHYSFAIDWWPERHVRLHLDYTIKQRQVIMKLGHSFAAKVSVCF